MDIRSTGYFTKGFSVPMDLPKDIPAYPVPRGALDRFSGYFFLRYDT